MGLSIRPGKGVLAHIEAKDVFYYNDPPPLTKWEIDHIDEMSENSGVFRIEIYPDMVCMMAFTDKGKTAVGFWGRRDKSMLTYKRTLFFETLFDAVVEPDNK